MDNTSTSLARLHVDVDDMSVSLSRLDSTTVNKFKVENKPILHFRIEFFLYIYISEEITKRSLNHHTVPYNYI